ncbi:MAG TPA: hypothetical protein VFM02_04175 [Candidatus Paceibacterota bacterium]|nr:hypothetical protein [Candidatus Paceibacterota bacterium]
MKISLENASLNILLSRTEKFLALHGSFSVPCHLIESVETEPFRFGWVGFRAPGAYFPGILRMGTYYTQGRKEFWCARREEAILVLTLKNYPYQKIHLGFPEGEIFEWKEKIAACARS